MVITPNSDIFLLKVPLSIDNKNQLTFQDKNAQFNYFNSLEKLEITGASYQRKDNTIRFPGHFDNLIGYDYCMYRNTNYSDKWFYAYITKITYVNNRKN